MALHLYATSHITVRALSVTRLLGWCLLQFVTYNGVSPTTLCYLIHHQGMQPIRSLEIFSHTCRYRTDRLAGAVVNAVPARLVYHNQHGICTLLNSSMDPLLTQRLAEFIKNKIDALTALLAHKLQFKYKNRVASVSQFQQI